MTRAARRAAIGLAALLVAAVAGLVAVPASVTVRVSGVTRHATLRLAWDTVNARHTGSAVVAANAVTEPARARGEVRIRYSYGTFGVPRLGDDTPPVIQVPKGTIVHTCLRRGPRDSTGASRCLTPGEEFRTLRATVLDPADRSGFFGSITVETEDVPVEALRTGPQGNVAANAITDVRLPDRGYRMHAQNSFATSGGAAGGAPAVAADLLAATRAGLEAELRELAEEDVRDHLRERSRYEFFRNEVFDRPPPRVDGDRATVEVSISLVVDGVDRDAADRAAAAELVHAPGERVVPGTLRLRAGAPRTPPDVDVTARAQVTRVDPEALRRAVAGRSTAQARRRLGAVADVVSVDIDNWGRPWLPPAVALVHVRLRGAA